ncbi:hypothetical protein PMI29_01391 [Pseudomonas sp. GM49]|nr:hypothetical protein PMI29_01391 [Pseudomonas sp. GM49]
MLNENDAGKPENIYLMTGRQLNAAFGNSTGDKQMLEYTKAGQDARLVMLVLHDRVWTFTGGLLISPISVYSNYQIYELCYEPPACHCLQMPG